MFKSDKLEAFLSKKKHISLLYIIVSICILLLAFGRCAPKEKTEGKALPAASEPPLAETLEEILGGIRGVGEVQVALTYHSGPETVPMKNRDGDKETVVTTGSGSGAKVFTEKELLPKVQGVVVVCTGGKDAAVKAAVLSCVMALTGVEAHSIAVFPAK